MELVVAVNAVKTRPATIKKPFKLRLKHRDKFTIAHAQIPRDHKKTIINHIQIIGDY